MNFLLQEPMYQSDFSSGNIHLDKQNVRQIIPINKQLEGENVFLEIFLIIMRKEVMNEATFINWNFVKFIMLIKREMSLNGKI